MVSDSDSGWVAIYRVLSEVSISHRILYHKITADHKISWHEICDMIKRPARAVSLSKCRLTSVGIPMIKVRRSYLCHGDRHTRNDGFDIETGPWYLVENISLFQSCATAAKTFCELQRTKIDKYIRDCTASIIHICGLAQDYSNSVANALELLQCCTKPSIQCTTRNLLTIWSLLWFVTVGC